MTLISHEIAGNLAPNPNGAREAFFDDLALRRQQDLESVRDKFDPMHEGQSLIARLCLYANTTKDFNGLVNIRACDALMELKPAMLGQGSREVYVPCGTDILWRVQDRLCELIEEFMQESNDGKLIRVDRIERDRPELYLPLEYGKRPPETVGFISQPNNGDYTELTRGYLLKPFKEEKIQPETEQSRINGSSNPDTAGPILPQGKTIFKPSLEVLGVFWGANQRSI